MRAPEKKQISHACQNPSLAVIVSLISTISLMGSMVGIIPVSPLVSSLIIFFPVTILAATSKDRVFWATLLIFSYFLISALCFSAKNFSDFYFYRYDGNFFPVYACLLALPILPNLFDPDKLIRGFVYYVSGVTLILLILYFLKGNFVPGDSKFFRLLFSAHNAAGGYLSIILGFSFAIFLRRPNILHGATTTILGICLFLTGSRGSLLSFILAVISLAIPRRGLFFFLAIFAAIQIGASIYGYNLTGGGARFEGVTLNKTDLAAFDSYSGRGNTVASRVFDHWASALSLFSRSVFTGTGFGSFNDLPYNLVGIPPLFSWNVHKTTENSDSHAHNTYFHVLGETGLIGLGLLIFLQWSMYRQISDLPNSDARTALLLGLMTAIFSAGTEHRFFTPSQMMPFVVCLGLVLSHYRNRSYC